MKFAFLVVVTVAVLHHISPNVLMNPNFLWSILKFLFLVHDESFFSPKWLSCSDKAWTCSKYLQMWRFYPLLKEHIFWEVFFSCVRLVLTTSCLLLRTELIGLSMILRLITKVCLFEKFVHFPKRTYHNFTIQNFWLLSCFCLQT